jgi:glycerophosphoryl diester phosphodiesterase
MIYDSIKIWHAVLIRLRATLQPVLLLNLIYVALGFVLLAPLTGAFTSLLIRLSGKTALANHQIASFILTPFGLIALLLAVSILITVSFLQQASIMYCFVADQETRGKPIRAVAFAVSNAKLILRYSVRMVTRLLLITSPFLACSALIAWLLITDHDINYYLDIRPPSFWAAIILIAIVLLVMITLLLRKLFSWSVSLPLALFTGTSPAECFNQSEGFTRENYRLVLGVLAIWAAFTIVWGWVVVAIVQYLIDFIVTRTGQDLDMLVAALSGLAALWVLLSYFGSSFSVTTLAFSQIEIASRLGVVFKPIRHPAIGISRPGRLSGKAVSVVRVVAVLIAGAATAVAAGAWMVNDVKVSNNIDIIAHRGAAGKAPENTLAAFHQAINDGADWIEVDVQETADGEIVVIHDSDFMKLAGLKLKVWDSTFEQVRGIDVGSWFDPRFADERVPSLTQVLDIAAGKAGVFIELKYYGHHQRLEERVIKIVEAAEMLPDITVMSLNYKGIQKVRNLRPSWRTGLLSATAIGDLNQLEADFFAPSIGMATPEFIRSAQESGKQVFVWTVNDPVSLIRMIIRGADGVITDEPEMAREVIEELSTMSNVEQLLTYAAVYFGGSVQEGFIEMERSP